MALSLFEVAKGIKKFLMIKEKVSNTVLHFYLYALKLIVMKS